jgi:hypothetical protein
LARLRALLLQTPPEKILYIKGSGHMGLLQNLPKGVFAEIGATIGVGNPCDGIGELGIKKGRGRSLVLPMEELKKGERFLIWGRNPAVTNPHLLPLLKRKEVAVIDIRPTETSKLWPNRFYQILPNRDYYLALLLGRLAVERGVTPGKGANWEEYRALLFRHPVERLRGWTGLSTREVEELLQFLLKGGVILTGLGVAKGPEGWKTHWAIDSLAQLLGYFGKEGRGVAFLGSSSGGLNLPPLLKPTPTKSVPLFEVDPSQFQLLFLQGGNPAISYPNRKVWERLLRQKSIVFGRYWDRSAQLATLFIPTEGFYNKPDLRGSYFDNYLRVHWKGLGIAPFGRTPPGPPEVVGVEGVSEYRLSQWLRTLFQLPPLPPELELIEEVVTSSRLEGVPGAEVEVEGKVRFTLYRKLELEGPPYRDRFPTLDGQFHYLTHWMEVERPQFWVSTGKGLKGLNSQFAPEKKVQIPANPVPPLRRWIETHLSQSEVEINPSLPNYLLFGVGGMVLNRFVEASGENGYYTQLGEEFR